MPFCKVTYRQVEDKIFPELLSFQEENFLRSQKKIKMFYLRNTKEI